MYLDSLYVCGQLKVILLSVVRDYIDFLFSELQFNALQKPVPGSVDHLQHPSCVFYCKFVLIHLPAIWEIRSLEAVT
jgi:hypothetical protein